MTADQLFDQAHAAIYLRTSEDAMQRYLRIGIGPKSVKIDGVVFYRRSSLDAYVEECRRSPRSVRRAASTA